jgi:large subunit ribosomal protein L21
LQKEPLYAIVLGMEFAVIKTGGKQYRVSKGDTIRIEKMKDAAEIGQKITFNEVLLVDNGKDTTIGMPLIEGAAVTAEVTKIGRADKVMVVKYLQKSRYHKKNGHRQPFVEVKITAIK